LKLKKNTPIPEEMANAKELIMIEESLELLKLVIARLYQMPLAASLSLLQLMPAIGHSMAVVS